MNSSFVVGAVDVAAFMLCATFLAYVTLIILPVLRHRRARPGDPSRLKLHFLIPCLNEEPVIEATVADLFKKFPAAHMWCIDDGSDDTTPIILARLAQRSDRVHVVTRRLPNAQNGKGPALNAGWRALVEYLPADIDAENVVIGVVDADGILDPRCPEVIAGPTFFGNPRVGAVQIQVRVVNLAGKATPTRARLLTRMQDLEFTTIIAGMQMLRRHAGSTAMGGNGQFTRMSALQRVSAVYGSPWEKALLEDFELGLRILLTGGQTEYCHDTWVAQQGPPTIAKLMRQRSRWAQGLMQCFRYFWPVLRSPQISTPAAMEIAYFLILPWGQLIGILIYLASMGLLVYSAVTATGGFAHWVGGGAWGLIPLFLLFGIGPLLIWGPIYRRTVARDISWRYALFLGFLNWPYSYVHHASTWWAFIRVLRSRHDWKKTERLDLPRRRPITAAPAPAWAPTRATVRTTAFGFGAGAGTRRASPIPPPLRPLPPPPRWERTRRPMPPAEPAFVAPAAPTVASVAATAPAPTPIKPPTPIVAVGTLRVAETSPAPRRHRTGERGARGGHAVVVGGRLKPAPPPALVVAGPGGGDSDG